MKKAMLFAVLIFVLATVTAASAQTLPSANSILSKARVTAAQQHKLVFVAFHASWCGTCRAFDLYLDSADVRPIIDRYFVLVRLNAMEEAGEHPERNNPGANDLLHKLGGGEGVPFFAFVDANGLLIVNSNSPKTGDIGYPVKPHEIDWFMKMLAKAVPSMTPSETRTLEAKLRK